MRRPSAERELSLTSASPEPRSRALAQPLDSTPTLKEGLGVSSASPGPANSSRKAARPRWSPAWPLAAVWSVVVILLGRCVG